MALDVVCTRGLAYVRHPEETTSSSTAGIFVNNMPIGMRSRATDSALAHGALTPRLIPISLSRKSYLQNARARSTTVSPDIFMSFSVQTAHNGCVSSLPRDLPTRSAPRPMRTSLEAHAGHSIAASFFLSFAAVLKTVVEVDG